MVSPNVVIWPTDTLEKSESNRQMLILPIFWEIIDGVLKCALLSIYSEIVFKYNCLNFSECIGLPNSSILLF